MSKGKIVSLPKPPSSNLSDPLQVNARLYNQVSELLEQLETGEHVTLRERFQALTAIARIQYVFVSLRKEKVANVDAGSSVRKYAEEFQQNAARGRKKIARADRAKSEPDDSWIDRGTDDPLAGSDPFADDDGDAA
jgi:hypothetical protein